MGVYIKGMEMPETCGECPFNVWSEDHEHFCVVRPDIRSFDGYAIWRVKHCPLIEVHEPHGRLIEADALLMRINHEVMEAYMDGVCYGVHPNQEYLYLLGEIIDDAPTVIPVSKEGKT